MLSMQSRTKKSTLVLLGCLALAGLASCSGGGSSGSSNDDMKIYPPPENRAPEAVGSIPGQTVSVGGTRTWNTQELEPYFRDPDGDTLTYRFEFVSGASLLRVISDGSSNELLAVRGLAAGTATVRVTASDPGGLTAQQDLGIRVEAVAQNRPPEAVGSIPDQTVAVGGTRTWNTQELEPYFRDPDGDTLTYTFEFVSGASLLRVISDGSGNELLAVRGLAAGTATVRVTASDPDGLTAQQDLDVQVQAAGTQGRPNFAEAIDITGRQTVEGQIDSPDDSVVYKLRIDGPGELTFRTSGEADVVITLYDSAGNIVQPLPAGQAIPRIASVPGERVAAAVPIVYGLLVAGEYFLGISAGVITGAKVGAFVLSGITVSYYLWQAIKFAELEVSYNTTRSFTSKDKFQGERLNEAIFSIQRSVKTKWTSLTLSIVDNNRVRVSYGGPMTCGTGSERSQNVEAKLTLRLPGLDITLPRVPIPFLVTHESAPRRIAGGDPAIRANVSEGGSATVTLTDYIEDPPDEGHSKGGPLTFTLGSVPSGLGATLDSSRLTIRAQDGATDGTITVTATDEDGECWNFPVQVTVTAVRDESCRGYPPGFTWDPFLEECNCYPLIWDWVVGTCA